MNLVENTWPSTQQVNYFIILSACGREPSDSLGASPLGEPLGVLGVPPRLSAGLQPPLALRQSLDHFPRRGVGVEARGGGVEVTSLDPEGEGGVEAVFVFHRPRLADGEDDLVELRLTASVEHVAEGGEGVGFDIHRVCLVHL